jgi:hypothetical protein
MSSKKEIHRYYRVETFPNRFMWACANSNCTHHMPSHYERMLVNKGFICWQCGEHGSLRLEHLNVNPNYFIKETGLIHPICDDCREIDKLPIIHLDESNENKDVSDEVIANLAKIMKRG